MSSVERGFLADLLQDHYSDHWYDWNKVQRRLVIVQRFRNCGQEGSRRPCPTCLINFYTRYFCKFRLCDQCARIYGKEIQKKIKALVVPIYANKKARWTVAMLTLSESSAKYRGRYPNREEYRQFNRNVSDFCRLFYGKFRGRWTRTGKVSEDRKRYQGAGWFAVNEFGRDNTNLHCHILLYGPWVPYDDLLNAWVRITGGDTGCYIKPIFTPEAAAYYVSKYITKPPRFLDPNTAVKFVLASKSQRRIRSGGIFYNRIKLDKREAQVDTCPFCLDQLLFGGVCHLSETSDGLNLAHVRKHRELYETAEFQEIVDMLPGGTLPVGLPDCPSLLPF